MPTRPNCQTRTALWMNPHTNCHLQATSTEKIRQSHCYHCSSDGELSDDKLDFTKGSHHQQRAKRFKKLIFFEMGRGAHRKELSVNKSSSTAAAHSVNYWYYLQFYTNILWAAVVLKNASRKNENGSTYDQKHYPYCWRLFLGIRLCHKVCEGR